ncbi:10851_t:CDS:2, partial [Cetraspora pellucida]
MVLLIVSVILIKKNTDNNIIDIIDNIGNIDNIHNAIIDNTRNIDNIDNISEKYMANICTLRDINSKGHRLESTREVELEEALRDSCKSNSELIDDFKNYQKNESKEIIALRSMKKILEGKLESAQKDAFSTQKEI